MARALVVLGFASDRAKARRWLDRAPVNTRVEFKAPKRTLPQNDRMWAMLTDISVQQTWHGQKLTPDDWKAVFTAALKRELRLVPALEGAGFVQLGASTSDMSREEMTDLIELLFAKGAEWGVTWSEPKPSEPQAVAELERA